MGIFSLKFIKYATTRIAKSEKGFTLIELLVAMFILTLIVFAFTPLLVGSIDRIHYAGDKSDALYQGQSGLEVDIAERNTVDGYELVFDFGDTVITVPGGLVEAEKHQGNASAWLSGFVPFVPSINLYLAPLPLVEGYNPLPIIVMGRSTDFELAQNQSEQFKFYDKAGYLMSGHEYSFNIINPPTGVPTGYDQMPEDYDQYARFELQEGLTNSGSLYGLQLKWEIENDIEVTVRSRLQVVLPYAVSVGEGQNMWISPNARETWKYKTQVGTGLGTFNDIIWSGFEFVGVTTSGRIIVWRDGEDINVSGANYGNLNGIAYGGGKYIIVGDGGLVLSSVDTTYWNSSTAGSSNLLAASYSTVEGKFVAVGNDGAIFSSVDGISWIDESPDAPELEFRGAAHGGSVWLAVGVETASAVIYKLSGNSWEKIAIATGAGTMEDPVTLDLPGLNDIIHDGTRFIAVGNSGTLITSTDGTTWEKINLVSTGDLLAVDWGDIEDDTDHYVAVGTAGTIVTWTGASGDSWVKQNTVITQEMSGVAVRWTK